MERFSFGVKSEMELDIFLKDIFQDYRKEEITFIGLGNPYRSDDGFGIKFINKIKDNFINSFTEFDNVDEVILNLCNDKSHGLVIFVDSSNFNEEPGTVNVFSYHEIEDIGKHFHKIPLKLYMKLLSKSNNKSFLIAVQIETTAEIIEPKLSKKVAYTLEHLYRKITK